MSEAEFLPFFPPSSTIRDKPQQSLSEQQNKVYQQVLEHFIQPNYKLAKIDGDNGVLSEEEKFWISHECILRYLRGSGWKPLETIQRLEDTLRWRREYGIYDSFTPDVVEPEAVTGKEFVFGYDGQGRPVMYLFLSQQNTIEGPGRIQLHVWLFERAIELMLPGVETVNVLIDYGPTGEGGSVGLARQTIHVLQTHYPERLGHCIVKNAPYFITLIMKIIEPFMDRFTRDKITFDQNVGEGFDGPELLLKEWGGEKEFVYDHDKYWPAMIELAAERKKKQMERWRELGAMIGLKEWDVRSGSL